MLASIKKNSKGIALMLVSSLCVCFGQLFWKLSENSVILLLSGFLLYCIGALVMIVAYKYGSLSVLQPVLSINYVISILLAATILNEPITLIKSMGVLVIIIGVVLIAGGDD